jgi:hypothetical protein
MKFLVATRLWKEGKEKKQYCENACDQNANKSHHLLYLWQPKPSIIIIMIARKKWTHLTTYDNTKKRIAIEFLLLSM